VLRKIAKDPRAIEQGTSFGPAVAEKLSAARDGGLRVIERHVDAGEMSSHASSVMERVVRDGRDPLALGARYIEAAGDPNYRSAFGKILADPQTAHYRFSREETAAVQKVTAVEAMRGMVTGTGSSGGFALPIVIDPSIMLSSSGAINPIRQLARQITISTTEWRGVSSAGVVASYDPEAGEVSDDTPTLAQPVILAELWRVFVPYSIEIGQDFGGLEQELLQLTADARDVLDATMFYSGSGTDQPAGVQTGLSTSQRVQTAGSGAFVLADVYTYKQALPARAYANASWAWHPNRLDGIYRFVASGSTTEPQIMPDGRGGPLLGKPAYEWTALPTGVTTGTKFGLYGDFQRAFTIVWGSLPRSCLPCSARRGAPRVKGASSATAAPVPRWSCPRCSATSRRSEMATAKQVQAKESFATTVGKVDYFVTVGQVLPAGHPVAKAQKQLFEPATRK
jgi:HK97 family phage major capsid protein